MKTVITSICRTPIGKFFGSFSNYSAANLGAVAIKEAVNRANIRPGDVKQVIMGQVISAGCAQNTARQCAIYAGLPDSAGALTVNKVCGSGLASIIWADQMVKTGFMDIVVAGGTENMTMAPYLLGKGRTGYRFGNNEILDSMYHDGLFDIYNKVPMGITGEIVAERYNISREEMDAFACRSHERALAAQESGKFDKEIIPVEIKGRKGTTIVSKDEGIRPGTTVEKLAKLKPAFKEGGMMTAGNSSQISDGASAAVIMSEELAKEKGLPILATIVDYNFFALKPELVMEAPVHGAKLLLEKNDLTIKDIDLVEHNEAFASASCAVRNSLEIPDDKFNVNGGAVALGHPLGCSGARILTTLYYALEERDSHRGLATICLGGGEAISMIIER